MEQLESLHKYFEFYVDCNNVYITPLSLNQKQNINIQDVENIIKNLKKCNYNIIINNKEYENIYSLFYVKIHRINACDESELSKLSISEIIDHIHNYGMIKLSSENTSIDAAINMKSFAYFNIIISSGKRTFLTKDRIREILNWRDSNIKLYHKGNIISNIEEFK